LLELNISQQHSDCRYDILYLKVQISAVFFPQVKSFQLDVDIDFSLSMLQKIVFSGANERSFREATAALEVLAELKILTQRIERITKHIGTERVSERNKATAAWEEKPLVEKYPEIHSCCTDVVQVELGVAGQSRTCDRRTCRSTK